MTILGMRIYESKIFIDKYEKIQFSYEAII